MGNCCMSQDTPEVKEQKKQMVDEIVKIEKDTGSLRIDE